jgi:hypothetical protein
MFSPIREQAEHPDAAWVIRRNDLLLEHFAVHPRDGRRPIMSGSLSEPVIFEYDRIESFTGNWWIATLHHTFDITF